MKKQELPVFKTEDEERAFWSEHDATDYVDFSEAREVLLPNLRPTLRTISIRLPEPLLDSIKVLAHKRDLPYQSLIKILLSEGVEREFHIQEG